MACHWHQCLSLVFSIGYQFCRPTTVKLELPTRAFHETKWRPQVLKEEFEDTKWVTARLTAKWPKEKDLSE